ncbi:MAG TPA: ATP-binding protein [Chthoniobacterales bacterium]|nr:ATP-binding protein [Chthoniobacterales bacterium]
MFWILLVAIVGATIAVACVVWRKWIVPWRELEQLVRQIGRGEQPNTFLIGGGDEPRRIGLALENILSRQRQLDRDAAKRASQQSAIFSAMQDGVLVLDGERRITLFNNAIQKLFGLNEQSLGAPLLEMVREATIDKLVSETFKKHETTRGEITLAERSWQVSAQPMHHGNGAKSGAVVLFHDITALRRADEMRRDFVANVSHELRTPLSILRGYIETMLDDPKMPRGETARILEVMDQHSKRLGLLANDLLTLAQLESGSSNLQLSEIDLLRFLSDLVRDWRKKFLAKKLEAVVDISDDCSIIYADEERLREVYDNLLDNAVKYSNKNGLICLRANRHGSEIALSVSDNGIGISTEDLPRIFERFYRADKARGRQLGGTGLGLSIVKHIAQQRGGRVEAESKPGKGTTIRVILPVVTQT